MATSQENIEFLGLFTDVLPNFDLPTACQIRNLTLKKISELEQSVIEQREAFRNETITKAEELGMTAADLFPPVPRVKAPPKFQNPIDPAKTWSGKGKQPYWIRDAIDSGKDLNDFLIPAADVDPETGF